MNSLRAKIVAILVGAIVCVVALATGMSVLVLGSGEPHHMADINARQILVVATLGRALAPTAPGLFLAAPRQGTADRYAETTTSKALAARDGEVHFVVTQSADEPESIASIEIAAGKWLTLPLPKPPPPAQGWLAFGGWILLVIIGTTGVAVFVANRVIRPLTLLESAALAAADGSFVPLPESGPAEVRAAAKAINRLSRSLREAMEGRMRLVAAAGHDLRTPMTRMRLRAEFLPEAERDRWRRDIDELDRIADSAIQLVRETSADGSPERVRLDLLIAGILAELGELGLAITAAGLTPAVIGGSPHALTRALRNVLANAATHGGGGRVSLARAGGSAVVVIEDNGPGIPEKLLERVFEPFFRVDPARRQRLPGAGLGLAIAKEIITRHGGAITLANRPAGGLVQEIRLPLQATIQLLR